MVTIHEHTIEESYLHRSGAVLDLGCINFNFSLAVREYCDTVISVDPTPVIVSVPSGIIFESKAVVSDESDITVVACSLFSDPLRNSIMDTIDENSKYIYVQTMSIQDIMKKYHIDQFDLIKMDIEGAEYDILDHIDWTCAKQYSIEFHDFLGFNPNGDNPEKYYEQLFTRMKPYCDIVKHEYTYEGNGYNYWDSLFVLKKEFHKS
jgi:FkbM family methyltransferase